MGYISAVRQQDSVVVWEKNKKGQRVTKRYDAPYYFYVKDKDGDYTSLYGDKLSRLDFDNSRDFYNAKQQCQANGTEMFESDIPPELKILSEVYYGKPDPELNVTFYDIEVDYSTKVGFASPSNPYAVVNAVALFHSHLNKMVVVAIPPSDASCEVPAYGVADESYIQKMNDITPIIEGVEIEIVFVETERALLRRFLDEIKDTDIICGWNNSGFDDPYIGKRLEKMGSRYLRAMCFPDAPPPRWRDVEIFGKEQPVLDLFGRVSLDYLTLFKKYMVENQPSYKLDSIADKFLRTDDVPDMPKLEYEGSLANLYRADFDYFIRYNIRDTEILHGFEKKLKYVALANAMVHISTGQFANVAGTIKLTELAVINYCHHELDVIVNDKPEGVERDGKIKGALVLDPKAGMHEWVSSVDLNSLYPSAIRACNISPETKRGQFLLEETAFELIRDNSEDRLDFRYVDGEVEVKTAKEWKKYLKRNNWCISAFGTVFTMDKQGVIPKMLADWYSTRKQYQKKQISAKNEAAALLEKHKDAKKGSSKRKGVYLSVDDVAEYDRLIEESEYYDRIQYVYKIKLNSAYGAICQEHFKFSDKTLGESTTAVGRHVVVHQHSQVNKLLTGEYDAFGEGIVYGDTDSTYFHTFTDNKEEAREVGDAIADGVNASFSKFMKRNFLITDEFDGIIKCGREIVSKRGIFVMKKKYMLHLVDLDGFDVDKLKVMGLDTKRTTIPKEISKKLETFIERLLKGENWDDIEPDIIDYKDSIMSGENILDVGIPSGINKLEEYTRNLSLDKKTRLPGHVAAAILYNQQREIHKDNASPSITSGMKIKRFYLRQPEGRFKAIALPTDMTFYEIPDWFWEFEIDKSLHVEKLVDQPINNVIKAIGEKSPTKQSMMIKSLFEF